MAQTKAYLNTSRQYMAAEHIYRLTIGSTPMKTTARMTGREAYQRNRDLERKYIKSLDEGKRTRLSRWMMEVKYV